MPDAYRVYESRYINESASVSAADALVVTGLVVPANRVWTILEAVYLPSAAETRTVCIGVVSRASRVYPITLPASWAFTGNVNQGYPLVREGMELKLFAGDYLYVARDAATAGSTMTLQFRYIDSDLPLYEQFEPQDQFRRGKIRRAYGGETGHSGPIPFLPPGIPGGTGVEGPGGTGEGGGGEILP